MACLLWMSSCCGTKFLGTKTTQFNEMSGVLSFTPSVSSAVKGLVSPIPRHQIPDSGSWERKPFFCHFVGNYLNVLNAFRYWVGAQALCTEWLILGWLCPTLFRSGPIYVCQATAGLGICWWAREAWPLSLPMTSSAPCWEGQVPGWEMAQCERSGENITLGWETESEQPRQMC